MLDQVTRATILRLRREGHGTRFIARALDVSRESVKQVIAAGSEEVPKLERPSQLMPHLERVQALHTICRGNRVRVHELLAEEGVCVPYSTLTRFCREAGIGVKAPRRVGRYHFDPGEEMQHDTSPHKVEIGGRLTPVQCASLVMCYSRVRFVQCYRRWTRFHVRVFMTEALRAFGGAAGRCMLDNSGVILANGSGPDASFAPEMQAFAKRFGFEFAAHRIGDADRSGRVERPFHHIENNFYPGRQFEDLTDLNTQLRAWCDRYNHSPNDWLKAVPWSLFTVERPVLRPLPVFIPEVYTVHERKVDVEGYINLHANRYSVDESLIGRSVEVHELASTIRILQGPRLCAEHIKREDGQNLRITLPEHRGRRYDRAALPPSTEESALRAHSPQMASLCDVLRAHHGGQALRAIRRLHRICTEYPPDAVHTAVTRAVEFGLLDLNRVERLVLRAVSGEFFRLPTPNPEDPHG